MPRPSRWFFLSAVVVVLDYATKTAVLGAFAPGEGLALAPFFNLVLVYNGSGTLTDRLLNGLSLNQILADENGSGTVSWYLTDRAGSVNDVIRYNSGTRTDPVSQMRPISLRKRSTIIRFSARSFSLAKSAARAA